MPESAPFARRGHKGGARQTTLVGFINDAVLSIGAADLSTWAGATTNGPATATIDMGTTSEETIEFTGITGNTLTGVTRGVGGTTPRAHSDNAPIVHSSQVRDYNEANQAVASVLGANPTVVLLAGAQTITGSKTFTASTQVGDGVALPTSAIGPFLGLSFMVGTPTGLPDIRFGAAAVVYDTAANRLWIYNNGWRSVALV